MPRARAPAAGKRARACTSRYPPRYRAASVPALPPTPSPSPAPSPTPWRIVLLSNVCPLPLPRPRATRGCACTAWATSGTSGWGGPSRRPDACSGGRAGGWCCSALPAGVSAGRAGVTNPATPGAFSLARSVWASQVWASAVHPATQGCKAAPRRVAAVAWWSHGHPALEPNLTGDDAHSYCSRRPLDSF